MLQFTYKVTINVLPFDDEKKCVERLSGTLEAEGHAHATKQVQSLAFRRCRQLERERGDIYGYENVQVELAPGVRTESKAMSKEPIIALINQYLEQARQRRQRNIELVKETEVHQEQISASIEVIDAVGQIHVLQQLLHEIQNGNA